MSIQSRFEMSRRAFLGSCLTAGASALAGIGTAQKQSPAGPANSPRHRNVLLLISDDQGLDQLGCFGNATIKTPHLDALAAAGVRFTNAFTAAASCSPSRATILTGLFPHQSGQYGLQHARHHFSLFDWVQTLPSLLKKNGYRTGLVGKLHVGPAEQVPFDVMVTGNEIMGGRDVQTMAVKAGEFFRQDATAPFFLLIGYTDPHRIRDGFGNDKEYPGLLPATYHAEEIMLPPFLPDFPEARAELADMYQAVTRMDAGVGLVLEQLRLSGRFDETLIIFVSDNGIPFPGAKTTLYDAGVHLPMIVRDPHSGTPGSENAALVSFVDIVPTILAWTSSAAPNYELPGRSFLPDANGKGPLPSDAVYLSHTFHEVTMYYPMRGVRTRQYKYITNLFPELEFPFSTDLFASKTWQAVLQRKPQKMGQRKIHDYLHRPPEELYDLAKDANEIRNLARESRYQNVLQELRSNLHTLREKTNDPWLVWEKYRVNRQWEGR